MKPKKILADEQVGTSRVVTSLVGVNIWKTSVTGGELDGYEDYCTDREAAKEQHRETIRRIHGRLLPNKIDLGMTDFPEEPQSGDI